jgi:RES domain-containing protein
VKVYRVSRRVRADLSGEGATLYRGRWNSPGVPVLYTALSPSLALVEYLVHTLGTPGLADLVLLTIDLGATKSIQRVDVRALPEDWKNAHDPRLTREIGDAFVAAGKSFALRVPSVHLPTEFNMVINLQHKLAAKMRIESIDTLNIDPRFLTLKV